MFKFYLYRILRLIRLISKEKYKKETRKYTPDYKKIRTSRYFDRRWYAQKYLAGTDLDPVEHYMTVGAKSGYAAHPEVDWNAYLKSNPDVEKAGLISLLHYERSGKKEGRPLFIKQKTEEKFINLFAKWIQPRNPKISVIVASYNYERYIGQTLKTLADQSYKNFEVIVVDDGSSDGSVGIIKKYAEKHPFIRLVRHPDGKNKGLAATVLLGVQTAVGDYISFCESDDYWTSDHLQKKVNIIRRAYNPVLILNDIRTIGENKTEIRRHLDFVRGFLRNRKKIDPPAMPPTCNIISTFSSIMIKRSELVKCAFNTPYDPWLDFWLYRQLMTRHPLFYVNKKLTVWRLHKSYNSGDTKQKYICLGEAFTYQSNRFIYQNSGPLQKIQFWKNSLFREHQKQYKMIEDWIFFDREWYAGTYLKGFPALDPVICYLLNGLHRERKINEIFPLLKEENGRPSKT